MILEPHPPEGNPFQIATVHGYTVRVSADGTNIELLVGDCWRAMTQHPDRYQRGYRRVRFPSGATATVHKLVALAWHGAPPTPAHRLVEHWNGDRRNNHKDNVRWATYSDNLLSAYRLGERDRKPSRKLNESAVYAMRRNPQCQDIATLADQYGAGDQTIRDALGGRTWKRVRLDQGRIDGTY